MAKKEEQKKDAVKKSDLEFISLNDFDSISGTYEGFIKNNYGIAVKVQTEDGLKAVGLSTVSRKLFKVAIKDTKFIEGTTTIMLSKGEKPKGKKYFLYSLVVDGEEIHDKTTYKSEEIFADL